ncbi:Uncharacterized protein family UPF0079, ATPase [Syntrophobotulus glycolicus DSM 8271]|uniref:tRNA threonylcarbamoyladenosine biosynthesis protein TsaE n=1 Tax=Syntrophobotulus glycolicus (strain DSM 8271 / FlGlyR) TaxID=645991 RepID=F0SXA5_SYNGF|nr:tRNA (adenosine(37)-N6)-threonylcarbamoyltransferase complex ATPase subunit type 1 TsaE [Syntrophobotulus glycolicus]ADY56965.1 Uncharacterized protein family UPF0079, ATPase [Syntrophobotulus glycolicus DSM 8271]
MEMTLQSKTPEQTFAFGSKLGSLFSGGEVLCLNGELGAGKTVLAKGLAKALAVKEQVTSPTFTMIQEYQGQIKGQPVRLVHMDLYRLRNAEEAEIIGVPDYFREDCICLLEWPEVIEDILPEEKIDISILGSGEEEREILIRADEQICRALKT